MMTTMTMTTTPNDNTNNDNDNTDNNNMIIQFCEIQITTLITEIRKIKTQVAVLLTLT